MNVIKSMIMKVMNMFLLKNTLESFGIKTVASEAMGQAVRRWENMYKNSGPLMLPSSIASETARLTTLELKSEIGGSKRAEYLNSQYRKVIEKIRIITEYACASGGVMLKPNVVGKEIEVSCIKSGCFIPTMYDVSGKITGAAFLDRRYADNKIYTRIEHHTPEKGGYVIRNYVFVSEDEGSIGTRILPAAFEEWKDIAPVVRIENLKEPLFAYFRMPMANQVDENSPLGVSVYSRCEKLIEDANRQYERLLWEFESGERALFVHDTAFKTDKDGNRVLPDKRMYRLICGDDLFEQWSPAIREENYTNGLNQILRRIEFNAGLAYGTLSDIESVDKTAEEIKESKQRSYSHIVDIQNSLKSALGELIGVMNTLTDLYGLCSEGDYSVSFVFDDSIVADRKTEFAELCRMVEMGAMLPWEVRMWYFGEDEETAKQKLENIEKENLPETALN